MYILNIFFKRGRENRKRGLIFHLISGVKGKAPLADIDNYNPIRGTTIDLLHCIDIGITKKLFAKIFHISNFKTSF